MTTQATSTISDYAEAHGIDAADLLALIEGDPEPVESFAVASPATITLNGHSYRDGAWPVEYLDLVASGIDANNPD